MYMYSLYGKSFIIYSIIYFTYIPHIFYIHFLYFISNRTYTNNTFIFYLIFCLFFFLSVHIEKKQNCQVMHPHRIAPNSSCSCPPYPSQRGPFLSRPHYCAVPDECLYNFCSFSRIGCHKFWVENWCATQATATTKTTTAKIQCSCQVWQKVMKKRRSWGGVGGWEQKDFLIAIMSYT